MTKAPQKPTKKFPRKQDLALNEARGQAILDNARDAIISIDQSGRITLFNRCAERIFGYSADEALGKDVSILMPSPYREEHAAYLENYEKTGIQRAIGQIREVQARRKSGEVFPTELSVSEVRFGDDVTYVAILRDVTERRNAEEALRNERDFAERLIDTAQVIVLVLDPEGRIVLYNRYMEEICGFRLEETHGKDWFSIFVPAARRERIRKAFFERLPDINVQGGIDAILIRNGSTREIEWQVRSLKNSQGQSIGVLAIGQDVTERNRAGRRRAAQYAVTRVLAEAASLAEATPKLLQAIGEGVGWDVGELWHVDSEAEVLRLSGIWSASSVDITQYAEISRGTTFRPGSGLPGRVWSSGQAVWIFDLASDRNILRAAIMAELGLHGAFGFPIRDGTQVIGVMLFLSRAVRDPDNDLLQLVEALGRQIGDFIARKRSEETIRYSEARLQERERLADIGAITAKIAHDLGNPLSALSMQAQLILRRARRNESDPLSTVLKPIEQLESEVRRLESLIRELMAFSREQRLDLKTVRPRTFLQRIVDLWQPLAAESGVTLTLDVRDEVVSLRLDEEKIRRVLDNLIKNALEAIDHVPGRVKICLTAPSPERVRISVEDSGPGVPKSVQVFRLFETTKPDGSGLGLAVSKQIIQAHGGDISYAPIDPHGTVFHVELPLLGPSP